MFLFAFLSSTNRTQKPSVSRPRVFHFHVVCWARPGADPGFFLGGGALVSCSTSTPINHIVFFSQNTSCIRKPQIVSGGGGGCAPPAPSP